MTYRHPNTNSHSARLGVLFHLKDTFQQPVETAREMFDFVCRKEDVPVDEVDLSVWNRWANRWDDISKEDSARILTRYNFLNIVFPPARIFR